MRRLMLMLCLGLVIPALSRAQDIVDAAAGNPDFSTLVAAVKAAGLVDTLKSPGPFTVFAPTNEAFAKLPAGTVENLLKPENKDQLTKVLTYHVVPGRVPASEVVKLNGHNVTTVEGSPARVSVNGGSVKVGDANVIKTDIEVTNGIIHVIDSVLLPPADAPQAAAPVAAPAPIAYTHPNQSYTTYYAAPAPAYSYQPATVYHAQPAPYMPARSTCGR